MGGVLGGHLAGDLRPNAARKYGVDVSVIVRLRALAKDAALAAFASAKPGRPASAETVELELLREENDRLSEALKEMAIELTLHREGSARAFRPGPRARERRGQARAAGLIDQAVADGWAHTRACRVLQLADVRAHRWRQRLRETGSLEDRDPGGGAVHGILDWEGQAILDLIETWGCGGPVASQARAPRLVCRRGVRLTVLRRAQAQGPVAG